MIDNPEHGMLPEGWEWRELGEVAEFINGGTPSTKIPEYWNGDIPWITGADVTSFWVHGGRKFIKKEGIDNSATHLVKEKTVLLVTRTGVGKVGIATTDLCFSQDITGVVCGKKILPEYLARFILSQENNLKRLQRGSTIKGLIRTDVEHLKIPLPPLPTQRRIVEILEKADALRKTRRLADEKTSKILQAAFVKMFGDPVRNEMGFEFTKLGEICDINPKKTEISDIPDNTEVSFLPMASISGNGTIVAQEIRRLSEVKKGFTYFREGDVLLAKITPCMENGKRAIATELKNGIGFGSTEFHILRPKEKTVSEWIFGLISQNWFRTIAVNNMTGTVGQQRVPADFLKNMEIPLPPLELQQKFAKLVESVEAMKERQDKSREHIENTFQALMQKAFRGELVA